MEILQWCHIECYASGLIALFPHLSCVREGWFVRTRWSEMEQTREEAGRRRIRQTQPPKCIWIPLGGRGAQGTPIAWGGSSLAPPPHTRPESEGRAWGRGAKDAVGTRITASAMLPSGYGRRDKVEEKQASGQGNRPRQSFAYVIFSRCWLSFYDQIQKGIIGILVYFSLVYEVYRKR
jgi:hypothetical protein